VSRRAGFTLIEIAVALVVVSLLMLIGIPKFTSAMTRSDVRGARTITVNLLAKARAASIQANRRTWLKFSGNRAWIIARPRRSAGPGTVDTLGVVENLSTRYGVALTTSSSGAADDSIAFDPRGMSWSGGGADTVRVSKRGHMDWVAIDGMGRVAK